MKVAFVNGNRQLPKLYVDKSVIENMCSPWKDALVVSLLGKRLGFRTMKTKLSNTWRLIGEFDLLDVDNDFFLVKFDREEDKKKVIDGGPWVIFDHYLAVATWNRSFICPAAQITSTLAWVRIPGLNVTFYNESFLLSMARLIGKPIKVDRNTLSAERGRFARICVEIDLTQPVVGKFWFEGFWYKVEYEGAHIICPKCGCYGHRGRECTATEGQVLPQPEKVPGQVGTVEAPPTTQETLERNPQPTATVTEGPKKPAGIDPMIVVIEDCQVINDGVVKSVDPASMEVAGEWLTVKYKKKKKLASPPTSGSGAQVKENIPSSNQPKQGFGKEVGHHTSSSKFLGVFNAKAMGPSDVTDLSQKKRKIGDTSKHASGPGKEGSKPQIKGKEMAHKGDHGCPSP
ncbi:uncharacterized protein LOC130736106 [Lotus japonicus]|uniref:uncharacterized protein LOC130736106 n=1 Tax=Lotus japonicus TaxID=34305 RepID=UPI00258D7FFD|nr:uncharacterized protein LOC130736106 [Lotus japonicus]